MAGTPFGQLRTLRFFLYRKERKAPLVIPNAVRNPASNTFGVRPRASVGEPTEQRAGRKKVRLSERSELPDFPPCKRREGV